MGMCKVNEMLVEVATKGSIYDEIIDNILFPNLHLKDALISEIAVSILSNKDKLLNTIEEGWFKYWFISTIRNQVKSSTSPFHKNVRETITSKFGTEEFDINMCEIDNDEDDLIIKEVIEERIKLINETRNEIKCTWFESEMFRLYYDEGMTYRAIEEEYDIDHCLCWHTVTKVRKRLESAIKNKKNN